MKKAKLNVEITELFMAQADRDRRFHGTIKREEGLVRGEIKVNEVKLAWDILWNFLWLLLRKSKFRKSAV